jgi:hypothetical protein
VVGDDGGAQNTGAEKRSPGSGERKTDMMCSKAW